MSDKETAKTPSFAGLTANLGPEHRDLVSKAFDAGAEIHNIRAKGQEANAKLAHARAQLARAGLLINREVMSW